MHLLLRVFSTLLTSWFCWLLSLHSPSLCSFAHPTAARLSWCYLLLPKWHFHQQLITAGTFLHIWLGRVLVSAAQLASTCGCW
jgi:hypothetical protein